MSSARLLATVLACFLFLGASKSTAAPFRSMLYVPYSESQDAGATPAASTIPAWRTAHDNWFELSDDEAAHFGMGFTMASILVRAFDVDDGAGRFGVGLMSFEFWVMWEGKDAVFPWERYGRWGGDGFSLKDLVCSMAGVGLALAVY